MVRRQVYFNMLVLVLLLLSYTVFAGEPRSHYRSFADANELKAYMKWYGNRELLISAHRGSPLKGYPENAVETFEHILSYHPCLIECDLRLSQDGHIIMMHDETLERTTTGEGQVSDYTLAQLKQFFLKDPESTVTGFRIPTFAEVLTWAKGKAILTVDVKRGVSFTKVIEAVRQNKAEGHVIIITYSHDDAKLVHNLAPDLMISAGAGNMKSLKHLLTSGIPLENLCVFVGVSEPDPMVYKTLHQNGIRAILGTLTNLDSRAAKLGTRVYRRLYQNGADILATDNVPLVTKAIKEMKEIKYKTK